MLLLFLQSCANFQSIPRVGIDNEARAFNGYTEDFLLEMTRYNGIKIERINANSPLEGLSKGEYDAVLTSLPPYEFNKAKYDFSRNFLNLGPVLIVPVDAPHDDLAKIEMAGIIVNDPAALILEKYPDMIIRSYNSIPDLLNAIVDGEINAALINRIPAVNYVRDLYAGMLKIVGQPLTDAGLHLITLKGEQHQLLRAFDRTIEKSKTIDALQTKWNL